MATITFTLSDFGLQSLASKFPVVRFAPSGAGIHGGNIFFSTPVEVVPDAAGNAVVELVPTEGVVPVVWYEVQIEHLGPGGQYTHFDVLDLRIHIPEGYNGPLSKLPNVPLSPTTVLVSLDQPPAGYRGWWLYSPARGQEMPLDDPLIGELRMVA